MTLLPSNPTGTILLHEEHAAFAQLMQGIECPQHTMLDKYRCFMLYQLARRYRYSSSDVNVAEVGVCRGGTAKLLLRTLRHAHGLLFDTFVGLPNTVKTDKDYYKAGAFSETSLEEVRAYLSQDCDNFTITPGVFPETADNFLHRRFSFVHVDVDIYQSARDCCEFFYSRLISGGTMLFDDYGFRICPGVRSAVDEYFVDKPDKIVYLFGGQCFVIKS